ncbi:MAG: transposase, partial [Firmicutes bacterium]|nr:transposase [Bacillota bacterium]
MAQAPPAPEVSRPPRPRYREERTLERKLIRRPGESKEDFRRNVGELRKAFKQFNDDVAGICQWAIRLRPNHTAPSTEPLPFWKFFLEPEAFLPQDDARSPDYRRLQAFDAATGICDIAALPDPPFDSTLRGSIQAVACRPKSQEAERVFDRLKTYSPPHRMILAKAAAEWIQSKYERAHQNWVRQYEEWEKEKQEWEAKNPNLTPEIRAAFNQIFQQLGVKKKSARICSAKCLFENKDNCQYAGMRAPNSNHHHSQLCIKFNQFLREKLKDKDRKYFFENAQNYLQGGRGGVPRKIQNRFPQNWKQYLQYMELEEKTIREKYGGRLPHCKKLGSECRFNPHTELCRQYKQQLSDNQQLVEHEECYREWRRKYWRGPRQPVFRYPSEKRRSTPKIFGRDYFTADFTNSVVGLRLDNMPKGQYLEFAFDPWPRNYQPQPNQTEISSVHLHFIGTRPRIGFRFQAPHRASRFGCPQEELDELRRCKFPRHSQDQQFLDAARQRLLETFKGNPEQELRLLAIDLGTDSAGAAIFIGKKFDRSFPLKILKVEKLYERRPKPEEKTAKGLGLSRHHVGLHLQEMSKQASAIAQRRQNLNPPAEGATGRQTATANLQPFDLRRLTRHTARMLKDWVRLNASQIIREAEKNKVDLIVLEHLLGFKPPSYDHPDLEKKRRVAFFAYGRIREKLTEKAVERGMRVVTVPYFASSKVCAKCGKKQEDDSRWKKNKRNGRFECEHCCFKRQADENAARVLGRVICCIIYT